TAICKSASRREQGSSDRSATLSSISGVDPMPARKSSSIERRLGPLVLLGCAAALAGCADYVKHRDTTTLSAGDSKAWNSVVHTVDPWPPYAGNTTIQGDGPRVARVIRRYSSGD